MENKIDNPRTAEKVIADHIREWLRNTEHPDLQTYPNLWSEVIEILIDPYGDLENSEYGDAILARIRGLLSQLCLPEVINRLCLEHQKEWDYTPPGYNSEFLNADNYKEWPVSDWILEAAAKRVLSHFCWDNEYDPEDERLDGYRRLCQHNAGDISELTRAVVAFRDARDWRQFHNPKDLAMALSIEASELLEAFLWKAPEAARQEKIEEELADVLSFALLLAYEKGLDVRKIIMDKLKVNEAKYPIDKSKGSARKYDEL